MYYVYILYLDKKRLYKGFTEDLKQRLNEHRSGKVESTKFYKDKRLIHCEAYIKKSDALRRERFLKTTEGKRLLRQQIRDLLKDIGMT